MHALDTLHGATVLVVDDNPTNLHVLSDLLAANGFTVLLKRTGDKAIEALQRIKPDIILLDIVMPGIDGFETCRLIKEHDATKDIPVIFMSALSDTLDKIKGFEVGAVDYITKPFQQEEVLARVKAHLTIKHLQEDLQQKNHALQEALERERHLMEELRLSLSIALPHELRTPLTVIIGFSSFLQNAAQLPPPEEIAEYGSAIYRNAMRLHRLVENSLLYANLKLVKYASKDRATWRPEPSFSLKKAILAIAQQRAQEAQRDADVTMQLEDAYLPISAINFEKILSELLENAFKFSPPGTPVEIKTVVNSNLCVISILDQGRGLTKEQIAQIGAYMQFGREQNQQYGFGLGLTIANLLTQLEGGVFSIESKLKQGTMVNLVFHCEMEPRPFERKDFPYWFEKYGHDEHDSMVASDPFLQKLQGYTPLQAVTAEDAPAPESAVETPTRKTSFRILVIDEAWENGAFLEKILTPLGFKVIQAFDDFDGINKTLHYLPDLMLIDALTIQAEDSKFLHHFRHSPGLKHLRIVAIADTSTDFQQLESLLTCCDTVLFKPVPLHKLFEIIQQYLPLEWVSRFVLDDAPPA